MVTAVTVGVLLAVSALIGAAVGYRVAKVRTTRDWAEITDRILEAAIDAIGDATAGLATSSHRYQQAKAAATTLHLMRLNTAEALEHGRYDYDRPA